MSTLEDIKARTEGHTEGPLLVDNEEQTVRVGYAGEIMFDRSGESRSYWMECRPNAELFAAAPKLLAALEAVEALHCKVPVYVIEAGDCKHGWDCESVEIDGESMCPDETEGHTCGYCAELNTDEYPDYPCATVQAIKEALR